MLAAPLHGRRGLRLHWLRGGRVVTKQGLERLREALPGTEQPEVWVRFPRQLGDVIFSIPFFQTLQRSWNAEAQAQG